MTEEVVHQLIPRVEHMGTVGNSAIQEEAGTELVEERATPGTTLDRLEVAVVAWSVVAHEEGRVILRQA